MSEFKLVFAGIHYNVLQLNLNSLQNERNVAHFKQAFVRSETGVFARTCRLFITRKGTWRGLRSGRGWDQFAGTCTKNQGRGRGWGTGQPCNEATEEQVKNCEKASQETNVMASFTLETAQFSISRLSPMYTPEKPLRTHIGQLFMSTSIGRAKFQVELPFQMLSNYAINCCLWKLIFSL